MRLALSLRRSFLVHTRTVTMVAATLDAARAKIADQVKVDLLSKTHVDENARKVKEITRTFISDTITVPTKEMYDYASHATLGDDVYFDASTAALEAHVAQLTGKEAAIFMPSGTASNQIGLRSHLMQPPYTILCDHRSHIYKYEVGGVAYHIGAALTTVSPANGHHLTLEDVKENMVYGPDIHFAPTEVISLENTLNGTIFPQDEIVAISDFAHSKGVKMHLDGARLWHVAIETATPMKELCDPFDSVSLCFSKGLGAPVGSMLVGTKDLITRARRFRKLYGGGMRQIGFLAASAAYALSNNFPRLAAVHVLTKKLQAGLEEIGVRITSGAETCTIFYDPSSIGVTYDEIAERGSALAEPLFLGGSRLLIHIQTSEAAVEDLLNVIRQLADEKKKAGFVKPETQTTGKYQDIYVRRNVAK